MYEFLISYDKAIPEAVLPYFISGDGPDVYHFDTRKAPYDLVQVGIYFKGGLVEVMQFTHAPPGSTLNITIPPRVGNAQFPWSLHQ